MPTKTERGLKGKYTHLHKHELGLIRLFFYLNLLFLVGAVAVVVQVGGGERREAPDWPVRGADLAFTARDADVPGRARAHAGAARRANVRE